MPLEALSEVPQHISEAEHLRLQESTPVSFEGRKPVLKLQVDGVRCILQPRHVWPAKAGNATIDGLDGRPVREAGKSGTLYITEKAVAFLAPNDVGFTLDYPSLSLHAVSRSMPTVLQDQSTGSNKLGCIYCQLDLSVAAEEQGDEADEDSDEMAELWIIPSDQEKLESIFEALSYCASLFPSSAGGEGEDGSSHPFGSFGPFGTGLTGLAQSGEQDFSNLEADGAFEDADEQAEKSGEDGAEAQLSEAGRTTLARLDALVQWPPSAEVIDHSASSPAASFHSSDPRRQAETPEILTAVEPTNTLIIVHLPQEVFYHPPLASALLDLLHAYGELHSWTPLPSFGRAIVVYEQTMGAKRAKEALDRLLLPLLQEGEDEGVEEDVAIMHKQQDGSPKQSDDGPTLRAYYGNTTALARLHDDDARDHLPVPTTDRNFLISPPGSPPVGWEPIREDPPNTTTLADDLIRALGSLRDRGLGVRSHTPDVLSGSPEDEGEKTHSSSQHRRTPSATTLMPPPSVLIPPRHAAVRSEHPLAHAAYDIGEEDADEYGGVALPGVTVQNVDSAQDAAESEANALDTRMNKNLSISAVKATVESMRGAPGALQGAPSSNIDDDDTINTRPHLETKITPTARPPLGP